MAIIAVLSDTHGLLRQSVRTLIDGVDIIIHAGDVGKPSVLEELNAIAPTWAVRGNIDRDFPSLPPTEVVAVEGALLYVIHDIGMLDIDPSAAGIRLVIFGHSHRPAFYEKDGVGYLNPGSIGPRRFTLPISLALVDWSSETCSHRFHTLGT